MDEQIRMDSHKLMFHPEIVSDWKKGRLIYPIEIEIGLSGACNHRCIFCAVDYIGYQTKFIDEVTLNHNLKIFAMKGVKSIIYSGEGEPLLHKKANMILNKTKEFGLDVALATNGVLLNRGFAEETLQALSWVRISIAAANDSTYEKIHRSPQGDLQKVLINLQDAVDIKRKKNLKTTIGAQLLLLPDNKKEVIALAKILREIGIDYFTIKPFSQHPQSKIKLNVDYMECEFLEKELMKYQTEQFKIIFRINSIENLLQDKCYDKCNGIQFMTHIDVQGNVFPCIAFVGKEEFSYGNIYDSDFNTLWESDKARKLISTFSGMFLKKNCRKSCRLDEINKYLYDLTQPGDHVNFI